MSLTLQRELKADIVIETIHKTGAGLQGVGSKMTDVWHSLMRCEAPVFEAHTVKSQCMKSYSRVYIPNSKTHSRKELELRSYFINTTDSVQRQLRTY